MLPRSAPSRLYAAIFVPVEPTSIPIRLKNSHAPVKGDDCSSDKPCLCVGGVAYPIRNLQIGAMEMARADSLSTALSSQSTVCTNPRSSTLDGILRS
jgi:hypothetical protein